MNNLTQNSATLSSTIQVPQDGVDNVEQSSVIPGYQELLNNDFYIGRTLWAQKPNVLVQCVDQTNILISPFYGLWVPTVNIGSITQANFVTVDNNSTASIDKTFLDTGTFIAGIYYIYAKYSSPGVAGFEISMQPPDTGLVYKGSDYSRRYLGSFIAYNNTGVILIKAFTMRDYDYTIAQYFNAFTAATTTTGGVANTYSLFGLGIPITAKVGKLSVQMTNNGAVSPSNTFLNIGPNNNTIFTTLQVGCDPSTGVKQLYNEAYVETPIQGGSFYTLLRTDGTSSGIMALSVIGYRE